MLLSNTEVLANRCLDVESIDEDKQVPMKKLRAALRGTDSLKEQLDSVIPFLPQDQRIGVTMEMISAWNQDSSPWLHLPEAVRRMYV